MKFKVIEFIRKTRDENYEKNKNLNSKEKIEYTKKIAEEFTKNITKRGIVRKQSTTKDKSLI